MPIFTSESADYPGLRFYITASLSNRETPQFVAFVQAEGKKEERSKWRRDFREWCGQHELHVTPLRYRGHLEVTTGYHIKVLTWPLITEFMLRWVGLDWMVKAAEGFHGLEQAIGSDVKVLKQQVGQLSHDLLKLRIQTKVINSRILAAARAVVDSDDTTKEILEDSNRHASSSRVTDT